MSELRTIAGVAAVTSGVVSLCVMLLLGPSDDSAQSPINSTSTMNETTNSIAELQGAIQQEHDARVALKGEFNALLDQLSGESQPAPVEQQSEYSAAPQSEPEATSAPIAKTNNKDKATEGWFSEQALYDMGLNVSEVEGLRQGFEELELEKLNLKGIEKKKADARFRGEIGDDNYDKVLYASGKVNRVEISDLPDDAPGANSGIMAGDVVYSYGGERVFDLTTFYLMTKGSDTSQSLEIEVIRDGERVSILTSGGVLGAKLGRTRETPSGY